MTADHDPFIVALDVDSRDRMLRLAETLRGEVETLKVGLELWASVGPEVVDELRSRGFRVFVDLKLHDIPHTVQGAVKGLVRRGVDMMTVHTCGGREMLQAAVHASREEAEAVGIPQPALLGVTVLTSLDETSARDVGWSGTIEEQVLSLAKLGVSCGLDGMVASAREAERLRGELGPEPIIVTPAIRLREETGDDQARIVDPATALSAGADYLVLGRVVTANPDPCSALQEVRRVAGLG